DNDGRVPVEAVLGLACGRDRLDVAALAGPHLQAGDVAVLRFDVDDAGVFRVNDGIEAIAAAGAEPVGAGDAFGVERAARPGPTAIVLQAAIDHVGLLIV